MTTLLTPAGRGTPKRARARIELVLDRLDHVGGIALAAGLSGLVALGIGSRVAMRVVALTSGRIGTGVRPESGAVPGTVTLDGTAFLVLAGTFLGIAVGLVVLGGMGRWLPDGRRSRWLTTAALAAVLPALALLDPANVDFRLFGPAWLAIGLFTVLPLGFGALLASLGPRFTATRRRRPAARSVRVLAGVGGLALTLMATVGVGTELVLLLPLPLLVLAGLLAGPSDGTGRLGRRLATIGRSGVVALAVVAAGAVVWRVVAVSATVV